MIGCRKEFTTWAAGWGWRNKAQGGMERKEHALWFRPRIWKNGGIEDIYKNHKQFKSSVWVWRGRRGIYQHDVNAATSEIIQFPKAIALRLTTAVWISCTEEGDLISQANCLSPKWDSKRLEVVC